MYEVEVSINGWLTTLPTNVAWDIDQDISIRVGGDEWTGEVRSCKKIPGVGCTPEENA